MLQILMPMAGSGKPFRDSHAPFPKALAEVRGRPLVEYAVASARPREEHRYVFVISQVEALRYPFDQVLDLLAPGCRIIRAPAPTAGALCSALLGIDALEPDQPLVICNGDQYLSCGIDGALADFRSRDLDVGIITFTAVHPRWSFARLDAEGQFVIETAEKRPISNIATVGLYYYKSAQTFFESGRKALLKNDVYNDQFYICPTICQVILAGGRVGIHHLKPGEFQPLGTPADVDAFEQRNPRSPLDDRC